MIHADTSLLVDALTGGRRSLPAVRDLIEAGEPIKCCTLVLFEWLRGPRTQQELDLQEGLFPAQGAVPFGPAEAEVAASLYRRVARPRGRDVDLAIAACAITHGVPFWTLHVNDFRDVPGLTLHRPTGRGAK